MCSARPDDRPGMRSRLRLMLIGVGIAVLIGGIALIAWRGMWRGDERRITECGVDAKGPYAKVRVNSLRFNENEGVGVLFTYDGHAYADGGSSEVPVSGSTTTFVRGTWPPRVVNVDYDGGSKGKITVPGRVASGHWTHFDPVTRVDPPGLRITPRFKALVQLDDKSLLGCELIAPSNED